MMAAFMSPLDTEVETAKALPRAETAVEVSVVIPCLNEANSIGFCVEKALRALAGAKLRGEVVVADNGSTDGSVEIAKQRGARVVHVEQRGYGAALRAGIAESSGAFIIMGDADDSYNFEDGSRVVETAAPGYDRGEGNRLRRGN